MNQVLPRVMAINAVAKLIEANGHGTRQSWSTDLLAAARAGLLPIHEYMNGTHVPGIFSTVKTLDIRTYLCKEYGADLLTAPANPTQTPASLAPEDPASDGPAPLTTNEIAGCFDGFHGWDSTKWKDNLQTPATWLKACRHQAGNQGRPFIESTWWPVQIAVELDKKHTNIRRKLRARFKNQEPLKPWFETMETHLPDDS